MQLSWVRYSYKLQVQRNHKTFDARMTKNLKHHVFGTLTMNKKLLWKSHLIINENDFNNNMSNLTYAYGMTKPNICTFMDISKRNQIFIYMLYHFHLNPVTSSKKLLKIGICLVIHSSIFGLFIGHLLDAYTKTLSHLSYLVNSTLLIMVSSTYLLSKGELAFLGYNSTI